MLLYIETIAVIINIMNTKPGNKSRTTSGRLGYLSGLFQRCPSIKNNILVNDHKIIDINDNLNLFLVSNSLNLVPNILPFISG